MHLIVGIDPGKTCAAVCLDLDGGLMYSSHMTFGGADWLITAIRSIGIPSIIACDREPNDVVRKVCAAFNAKLFYPSRMMTADEKHDMARPYLIGNQHERDACAAAVKAYRAYANKFKQAEHIARSMNIENIDAIRAKVVSKFSINEAILEKKANRK